MLSRIAATVAVASAFLFGLVTWAVVALSPAGWFGQKWSFELFDWTSTHAWVVNLDLVLDFVGGDIILGAVVIVVAAVLFFTRRTAFAIYLLVSAVVSVALVSVTKSVVSSSRPPTSGALLEVTSWSYPSGHASAGIAVIGALGLIVLALSRSRALRVLGWALIVLGVMVGVSRLSLGVHWLADVVGGWLLGLAVTSAAVWLIVLRSHAARDGDG